MNNSNLVSVDELRVIDKDVFDRTGVIEVIHHGDRASCYKFMKQYRKPAKFFELMYSSGRLSSWVL